MSKKKLKKLTKYDAGLIKLGRRVKYYNNKLHGLRYTKKGTLRKRIDRTKISEAVKNIKLTLEDIDSHKKKKPKPRKRKIKITPDTPTFPLAYWFYEEKNATDYVLHAKIITWYKDEYDRKHDIPAQHKFGYLKVVTAPVIRITDFLGLSTKTEVDLILQMIDEIFAMLYTKKYKYAQVIFWQKGSSIIGFNYSTDLI